MLLNLWVRPYPSATIFKVHTVSFIFGHVFSNLYPMLSSNFRERFKFLLLFLFFWFAAIQFCANIYTISINLCALLHIFNLQFLLLELRLGLRIENGNGNENENGYWELKLECHFQLAEFMQNSKYKSLTVIVIGLENDLRVWSVISSIEHGTSWADEIECVVEVLLFQFQFLLPFPFPAESWVEEGLLWFLSLAF